MSSPRTLALGLALAACAHAPAPERSAPATFLTYVSDGCSSDCAAFSLAVRQDGTVHYCGLGGSAIRGGYAWRLSPDELRALGDSLDSARLGELDDAELSRCSGPQRRVLEVRRSGVTRRIEDSCGGSEGPEQLADLERALTKLARAEVLQGRTAGTACAPERIF